MKTEPIKILFNRYIYAEVDKISHVFGTIFMANWDFYYIMSVDAIKQHMTSAIKLVEEIQPKPPAAINKTIKAMRRMIDKVEEKEHFLQFISDLVLAKEGLGLLPGFGCAFTETNEGKVKVKAKIWLNPEKQSIRAIK